MGRGFYPVKTGYLLFRTLNYCLKKPHKTYIGGVRCDAGRVFDYTSYFVTVGLSDSVQLRLLGNYSVMLELLESLLCYLARHFLLCSSFSSFFFLFLELCFLFSGFKKDVSFNVRVSSLTESGLYKHNNEVYRHKKRREGLPAQKYKKQERHFCRNRFAENEQIETRAKGKT